MRRIEIMRMPLPLKGVFMMIQMLKSQTFKGRETTGILQRPTFWQQSATQTCLVWVKFPRFLTAQ